MKNIFNILTFNLRNILKDTTKDLIKNKTNLIIKNIFLSFLVMLVFLIVPGVVNASMYGHGLMLGISSPSNCLPGTIKMHSPYSEEIDSIRGELSKYDRSIDNATKKIKDDEYFFDKFFKDEKLKDSFLYHVSHRGKCCELKSPDEDTTTPTVGFYRFGNKNNFLLTALNNSKYKNNFSKALNIDSRKPASQNQSLHPDLLQTRMPAESYSIYTATLERFNELSQEEQLLKLNEYFLKVKVKVEREDVSTGFFAINGDAPKKLPYTVTDKGFFLTIDNQKFELDTVYNKDDSGTYRYENTDYNIVMKYGNDGEQDWVTPSGVVLQDPEDSIITMVNYCEIKNAAEESCEELIQDVVKDIPQEVFVEMIPLPSPPEPPPASASCGTSGNVADLNKDGKLDIKDCACKTHQDNFPQLKSKQLCAFNPDSDGEPRVCDNNFANGYVEAWVPACKDGGHIDYGALCNSSNFYFGAIRYTDKNGGDDVRNIRGAEECKSVLKAYADLYKQKDRDERRRESEKTYLQRLAEVDNDLEHCSDGTCYDDPGVDWSHALAAGVGGLISGIGITAAEGVYNGHLSNPYINVQGQEMGLAEAADLLGKGDVYLNPPANNSGHLLGNIASGVAGSAYACMSNNQMPTPYGAIQSQGGNQLSATFSNPFLNSPTQNQYLPSMLASGSAYAGLPMFGNQSANILGFPNGGANPFSGFSPNYNPAQIVYGPNGYPVAPNYGQYNNINANQQAGLNAYLGLNASGPFGPDIMAALTNGLLPGAIGAGTGGIGGVFGAGIDINSTFGASSLFMNNANARATLAQQQQSIQNRVIQFNQDIQAILNGNANIGGQIGISGGVSGSVQVGGGTSVRTGARNIRANTAPSVNVTTPTSSSTSTRRGRR